MKKWLLTYPEDGLSVLRYKEFVRLCGAEPVLLDERWVAPPDLDAFDALLLSGGGDVDPALYGAAERHPKVYDVDPARDELELQLIDAFCSSGRPVFGICRGVQILNVYAGGGLIQHVPDICPEQDERHERLNTYDAMHALRPVPETRLGAVLASVNESNSAHHQALDPQRIGRGLRVAALSGGGVIEAVESAEPAARLSAVQWHPERLPPDHPAAAVLAAYWRALGAE